ncbi:MAG: YicC family protein [Flavobacteriales bacterium]|nr:YicC family protein [Flavobacteriales bacterium]MCB9198513.1 YicC family protein [Flavobacteriales bacterium]
MIKSMTGFGRSEATIGNKKVSVEVKSLNSKGLDLNLRLPSYYRTKEMELRSLLSTEVSRGKCDVYISYEVLGGEQNHTINKDLLGKYLNELRDFEKQNNLSSPDHLSILMRMPDALISNKEDLSDEEWRFTEQIVREAIANFHSFRAEEGNSLYQDLLDRIQSISKLQKEVEQYENERIITVRDRINKNLNDMIEQKSIDMNRFEQEIIYYLEKYDVSEEKVRLDAHLNHFIKTMQEEGENGKKLGFISQEIGREINTLGSKANHAEMQKIVVLMKDELERIKEQVLNVL